MANRVPATVTAPTFVNGVLHLPGETAYVDLDELGVKSLDDDNVLGLSKPIAGGEAIQQVPVAEFAPSGDGATEPQQIPPGSRNSGTGRILSPASDEQAELSVEMTPPAADGGKPAKS